ncbi:spermidine/putrescine ABC transporter [Amylibacter kogurei]|uniref:Spermidine/putrescine ABC transporter n=1 Tax=Paramylibacter kogurei TaxID=1889778 RepID=A0A2G5K9N8_9RHOB|nr:ABC transporter permease [Amylibacter kogurei]PIB25869.1 spermidine/putrescine ABC transporter [Amylibacter kogurei]
MLKSITPLKIYILFFLVFLYAPAILLPIFAFNDSAIVAFPLKGFTTEWFGVLWETEALHSAAKNSFIIAITTAILSTLLGMLAARANARYKFPMQRPMMGLIMLPMVLPEIIVGVSLLVVILQLGFDLSLWTIILGHVLICTPFCIAILSSAFMNLDQSLEEASFDLGQTRLATFWLITVPLVMPGLISSLLISFTISLDEFIIAFFLAGTEPTLPVYIWGQLRFPQRLPSLMALGTLLLAVSLVLLILAEYFRRRGARKTGTTDTGGFL